MEISNSTDLGDAFAEFAEESLALAEEMLPAATEAWAIADGEPRGVRVARTWIEQITRARYGIPLDSEEARRILGLCFRNRPCNDCAAPIGQPHQHGCDVERCQYAGIQWIGCGGQSHWRSCDCEDDNGYDGDGYTIHSCGQVPHDCGSEVWDGVWPGYEECVSFGWFSRFVPVPEHLRGTQLPPNHGFGHLPCGPEHPDASADLNRIYGGECRWDRSARRWVKR